jgi:hypothetical protein
MAHHRLRHDEEARRCLNEARRWIDARHSAAIDLSDMQPPWSDWDEPVVNALLLREAEALLQPESEMSPEGAAVNHRKGDTSATPGLGIPFDLFPGAHAHG